MNLTQLKQICAAYHGKAVSDLTDVDTDIDLFLVAANNVRKTAERNHNFEDTWVLGTLDIKPTLGGALSAVVISPANEFSGVREIIAVSGVGAEGCRYPLILRRPGHGIERTIPRVPTDAESISCGSQHLILRGGTIYKYPDDGTGADLAVELEAYGWLKDYTDVDLAEGAAVPDFIVEHGFEFLQWSIIIELNYKFQSFVFRQEGNPGAPEKLKMAAWDSLVLWDSYRASTHFSHDR